MQVKKAGRKSLSLSIKESNQLCSSNRRRKRRRRMEAQGGEVRRIHIVYFLSHMGHVEHPHLIRVQHFNRNNGVYLRDVKRWLADLRGKDMPEAFAWSYKRRYKTGYVWQDLLDDDLITPISDIEYVLKGSEIVSASFDHHSHSENKASILKRQQQQQQPVEVHAEDQPRQRHSSKVASFEGHPETNTSTDFSSEINQESPLFGSDRSTLTNESLKLEAEMHQQGENLGDSSFCSTPPSKKNKMKSSNKKEKAEKASSSPSSFTKSKSYSSGASSMLRNLITCGAADTNDAALIMMNRADKNKSSFKPNVEAEIRKGERLGGSARVFGTTWNQQQQQENHQQKQQQQQQQHNTWKSYYDRGEDSQKKQSEFPKQKAISSTYKPMAWPNCSQCRKSFKPEKLHSHMKSCKGMKALVKTATVSTEKTPSQAKGSMASSHKESPYGYFLMNE
ncbi:protein UPSTREAM OF FLC-like isoform X1 [Juglans regia]|uniref:Protein UPSTREAM OF FLC isoform X1 n=2 Tax=Juglans regia TaxID=51240 RepID=A0A2I4FDJ7_JUGRE|nr:protein UPSTREAM OF FLC isoform X1 [Juglans regia]XP_035546288.1 protein UPSTREAM OF FLC-like isoform X1 [Juglans regia]